MNSTFITPEQLRAALQRLTLEQVRWLSVASSVSLHTLIKIRHGVTEDPGLKTVAKLLPHMAAAAAHVAPASAEPTEAA